MHTKRHESISVKAADRDEQAFTLLELMVVIVIIVVLAGLLFPAVQSILERAKKVQAKNDLTQIVTAVNAFYTEYGKYPLTSATSADTNYGTSTTNDKLFNELRNSGTVTDNTRGIVFMSPPNVKDSTNPKSGIAGTGSNAGQYFDPWGSPYFVRLDTDYDNQLDNPYNANGGAGPDKIRQVRLPGHWARTHKSVTRMTRILLTQTT